MMDPKTAALIWRFIVGLLITELPIVSYALQQPAFDWRFLAAGLIGGLVAALEKFAAPQLADTLISPAGGHAVVTLTPPDPTATPGQP